MWRLWPGWLLCMATAGLFLYMSFHDVAAVSAAIGMDTPDVRFSPYNVVDVLAVRDAFIGQPAALERYLAMLAGPDQFLPPMLAASIAFLGFASMYHPGKVRRAPIGAIFAGIAALPYMLFDLAENAAAIAFYSPQALALPADLELAAELPGMTFAKNLTLLAASLLIVVLWIWDRQYSRRAGGQAQDDS